MGVETQSYIVEYITWSDIKLINTEKVEGVIYKLIFFTVTLALIISDYCIMSLGQLTSQKG
jgi:hypothetical protein